MHFKSIVNIEDMSRLARKRLPGIVFDYLDGGAEDEVTLQGNRAAFNRYVFKPRVLPGTAVASLRRTLLGQEVQLPFIVGPTGLNGIFRNGADLALAKAAADAGAVFALSSAANVSLETVAKSCDGVRWFQLYPWGNADLSRRLIARAHAADYHALVVTVDALVSGKRERDLRNDFAHQVRITPKAAWQGITHPRWLCDVWLRGGMPRFENIREFVGQDASAAELANFIRTHKNPSLDWDDIRRIRDWWPRPLLLKGLLTPGDAQHAKAIGVDGVIVSNHGGRQLDGSVSTLEALAEIAPVMNKSLTLVQDGGFRRGTDILKSLALGADAVLLGRAPLYGVSVAGQQGVAHVLQILREEVLRGLDLLGCRSLEALSGEYLGLANR